MAYKDMQKKEIAMQKVNERNKKVFDRVTIMLPKGEKQRIEQLAHFLDTSVNRFIIDCIYEQYPQIQTSAEQDKETQ